MNYYVVTLPDRLRLAPSVLEAALSLVLDTDRDRIDVERADYVPDCNHYETRTPMADTVRLGVAE